MITTVTLNVAIDKLYQVEKLLPGEVMRVKTCVPTAGGKGLNVTKVAKALGAQVTAAGFVGGHAGRWILEELDRLGIAHGFVHTDGETRTCINIHDLTTGKHTEFLEPGSPLGLEYEQAFLRRFDGLADQSAVVTVSGSIPKGIREDIYSRLIGVCRKKGKKICVDTSGSLLQSVLDSGPDLIKPNTDELRQIFGREIKTMDEVIQCGKDLHQRGIGMVVVSLGKDGAVFVCRQGVFQGTTPDIPVVNTVGCGDSMLAGLAVALEKGLPVEDCIKVAMAASTANAMTEQTGYVRLEDYQVLMSQVGCVKIDG